MRNNYYLALKFRKKGLSYNEIFKKLGVPKSTMHYWFRNLAWSEKIKNKLTKKARKRAKKQIKFLAKINKERWEKLRKKYQIIAKNEFNLLKLNPLFIPGLMLYWAEGDSKPENSLVRLSNISPGIIKTFSRFLSGPCQIPKEKIKMTLILYPDLKENTCKRFWSRSAELSQKQFRKSQCIKGKHPTKRISHGICNIYVSSRELKEKILTWINLYQAKL